MVNIRFLLCGIFTLFTSAALCRADSISNLAESNSKVIAHPLIQGFSQMFFGLHTDNFIELDEMKQNKLTQENNIESADSKDFNQNDTQSPKIKNKTSQNPQNPQNLPLASKPKVLLIMDDLSKLSQIKALESLPLNITPSIFPKTRHNAITPSLAERVINNGKSFMIHLPLEAQNFIQKELEPLKVGIDKQSLKEQILQIKRDFPHLVYLNNHTGSKFTQSKTDMKNLLEVFDELNLKFIDSVTIPNPASELLAKEQKRLIMQRDIFLDNQTNVAYTKKQLQSLIQKAKKKGYAIAICHPHPSTFKALTQMQKELNANLELVSPSELENFLRENNTLSYVRSPFF
ncbi:divergent polysaccharide deacetylase family protein [Helicobacter magdeburgensis]|uniref:Divergent polysaccharide deacetylase family protein n=1 Tax=Helicobacter magdeburgensis TaxID=471858 RepID=A0A4U8T1I6_9HELI|nr:divergent polysaccharide deacetylase family protein [Helicobacter magdeburgensis]